MALTGKQKRVLRSLGQLLEPIVHVGKDGVSAESIAATEDVFRRRELIKVRVLKTAPDDKATTAAALAEATHSDVAGGVGFTILLYRANPDLKERIKLPPAKAADTDTETE
ncbi:MAG TPA: YhbY family RNA-binding protein [Armatimonadota bacterium]